MITPKRHNAIVLLLLLAGIIVISLALPRRDMIQQLNYSEGKPWLNPMLTAPFDIPIERDEASRQRITDSVNAHFVKIYRKDLTMGIKQTQALTNELNTRYD